MTIQDKVAMCPYSNRLLAAGYEAIWGDFGEQWIKPVKGEVSILINTENMTLGGRNDRLQVCIVDLAGEESRGMRKAGSIEQVLRWAALAERKVQVRT
jgi:hypothetical protein